LARWGARHVARGRTRWRAGLNAGIITTNSSYRTPLGNNRLTRMRARSVNRVRRATITHYTKRKYN